MKIPDVWCASPWLAHYRQPVWDGIAAMQANDYRFRVLGALPQGRNVDIQDRDYLRPISHLGAPPWQMAKTEMRRLIEQERPAVIIQGANPRHKEGWEVPRLARRYGGIPVLWTKAYSYSNPMYGLRDWIKRRFYRGYEYAIVYSPMAATEMVACGMPRERIFVAWNTIDTRRIFEEGDRFAAGAGKLRETQGLGGKKILLDLGRMDPEKRHDDVLQAWPRLRQLDPALVLVLVGGGPLLEKYRGLAQEIDPARIRVIGRVAEGEDYLWIAASDITIQCGAVGLAINQSMAFGTPTVIADQIGPDTELLVDGQTGWRYPQGDLDALVATVAAVMGDDTTRQRITNQARCLVRDDVNIDNMVRNVDACIRAALVQYHSKAGH